MLGSKPKRGFPGRGWIHEKRAGRTNAVSKFHHLLENQQLVIGSFVFRPGGQLHFSSPLTARPAGHCDCGTKLPHPGCSPPPQVVANILR
jgi:hypothetical protein